MEVRKHISQYERKKKTERKREKKIEKKREKENNTLSLIYQLQLLR